MADKDNQPAPIDKAEAEKTTKYVKDLNKKLKELGINVKDFDDEILDATEVMKDAYAKLGGVIVGSVIKNFQNAAISAMSSGDALATAAGFMKSNIDLMGAGFQIGANSMIKMGEQMVKQGNNNGRYMAAAGQALGALTGAVQELTKAGIDFMLTQTKTMLAGFQQMSASGAVFAGGMTTMTKTANSAGLTLEQFGKVVSENKTQLAQLGIGVAAASQKMADVMASKEGKNLRNGLYALGMTAEEQAAAMADTMANMAGPSGKLKASNAEVAQQTEEYARNLKMLSDLTGEDMKAKQDQIRQENDTLAFQQQLDGMSEKERFNITESMKGMSEIQRKALRERMIYGTVISKDAALAEATNSGIRKSGEEFANAVKDHSLTLDKTLKIQGENADETHRQAMNNRAIGMSQNADVQKAAADQLKTDQLQRKLSEARTEEEKKKLRDQINAGKAGTDTGAKLMDTQQNFQVRMQEIAEKNLPSFATALDTTIDQINGAVSVMANGGASMASMMSGWVGLLVQGLISAAGAILPSMYAASKAKSVASAGIGAAEDALASKAGGGLSALGKGAEELGGGAAKGAKISVFLTELAEGLTALTPAIPVILTLTAAVVGLGFGLKLAAPAFESIGKAVTTIIGGVADALIKIADDVNPLKLLAIAPGIAAIGFALLPFGLGGALSGIVGGTGGFGAVVEGIQQFESLNPDKLMAVAGAMKKLTESMPSAADLLKIGAIKAAESLFGGDNKPKAGSTSGTATGGGTESADMSKLMMEMIALQKQTNAYLKDNVDYSKKILHAAS